MKIIYAEEFWKQYRKLPAPIQRLYHRQENFFKNNWRDPRLHTAKLSDHPLPYSFRITRNYRVLFIFVDADTALLATIGNRKDVYR